MSRLTNITLATHADLDHASHFADSRKPASRSHYQDGFNDATQGRGYAPPSTPFDVEEYILGYFDARLGGRKGA